LSKDDLYVRFKDHVFYRGLERPCLFDVIEDELYELEDEGLALVDQVDGTRKAGEVENRDLLDYADSEGLLSYSGAPRPRELGRGDSPLPSLRYLELLVTSRCNLRCRHCYLGESGTDDMTPALLRRVLDEFDRMQGLRLLVSGGEPLMYPYLSELGRAIEGRGFRSVLVTNGVALDRKKLEMLPVHEVQVSLDGTREGHEILRGTGTFEKAVAAARLAIDSGLHLSIATMIHAGNVEEMDELEKLVEDLGAREWSLEVPAGLGRWVEENGLEAGLDKAGELMSKGFGGSYHGSSEGYACGLHLASVTPGGEVASCGFFAGSPLGEAGKEGLAAAWSRKKTLQVSDLDLCRECHYVAECAGGCRYRAGGLGPDAVMCAAYGWPMGRPPFGGA